MSLYDSIHFIRPLWLALLPLAILLPLLWRRLRRPAGDWARVCDPHLLRWLSVGQGERKPLLGPWLAGAGIALTVLALAGPSWQQLPDTTFSARDARVIALDLSRSMLAQDLRPDRLTRARFALADVLQATEEGQVGLVAFAGDAYVVSPLTNDMNTIVNLLPALQPNIMPVAGSRADLALDMAATLLERSGLNRGQVLLVTDSADPRDAHKARELRDRGILTSVLAAGSAEGAPIPSGSGFVSDRAGNVVIARMDRARLRALADKGGGNYSELARSTPGAGLWAQRQAGEFERREDALEERWKDAGPWLVLLLLPLAMASFRRGLFFVIPVLMVNGLLLPRDAAAGWWEDLWLRKDQQAYQALRRNEPEAAAELAEDPSLAGEAWYRSSDFANALDAWAQEDSADSHYNRGNALAHLGKYDAAIDAYEKALARKPDMEDARFNRELVERMKQRQPPPQQDSGEQGQPGEGDASDQGQRSGKSRDSDSREGEEGEDGEEDEKGAEAQDEEQARQSQGRRDEQQGEPMDYTEAWSEEDAQAMEQWLRRIPDDPGGLLRRKFRNQHQLRGAPGDEAESW